MFYFIKSAGLLQWIYVAHQIIRELLHHIIHCTLDLYFILSITNRTKYGIPKKHMRTSIIGRWDLVRCLKIGKNYIRCVNEKRWIFGNPLIEPIWMKTLNVPKYPIDVNVAIGYGCSMTNIPISQCKNHRIGRNNIILYCRFISNHHTAFIVPSHTYFLDEYVIQREYAAMNTSQHLKFHYEKNESRFRHSTLIIIAENDNSKLPKATKQ